MNTLTCHAAEELLDLHAAGECDPADTPALEQHLAACPSCARKFDEAVRLMAGLDWHHRADAGLERLIDEIEAQPLPFRPRKPRRAILGRFVAAAALVLVSLGLTRGPDGEQPPMRLNLIAPGHERVQLSRDPPAPAHADATPKRIWMELDFKGSSSAEYRDKLVTETSRKGSPAPLEVEIVMELRNPIDRELFIDLASPDTRLTLDLHGPGVLKLPLPGPPKPLGRSFHLPRLDRGRFPMTHLIGGTAERRYALYWTEPGTYTLTARLSAPVQDGEQTTLREFILPRVTIDVLDPRE